MRPVGPATDRTPSLHFTVRVPGIKKATFDSQKLAAWTAALKTALPGAPAHTTEDTDWLAFAAIKAWCIHFPQLVLRCSSRTPVQSAPATRCVCCCRAGLTNQGITAITTESTELGNRNYFARTDTLVHTQARPLPSWVGAMRCRPNPAPSLSSC